MALDRFRVLILAVCITFPVGCGADETALRITVKGSSGEILSFQLSNATRDRITIRSWQTPWTAQPPFPLVLSVHVLNGRNGRLSATEQAAILVTEVTEDVAIEPGESIFGEVDVSERFVDSAGKDTSDIYAVHWTYSLPICDLDAMLVNIGVAERQGGSLRVVFQETSAIRSPEQCGK